VRSIGLILISCSGIATTASRHEALPLIIVPIYGNTLISKRNCFCAWPKTDSPAPSEICALDFKGEFRRIQTGSASELSVSVGRFFKIGAREPLRRPDRKDPQPSPTIEPLRASSDLNVLLRRANPRGRRFILPEHGTPPRCGVRRDLTRRHRNSRRDIGAAAKRAIIAAAGSERPPRGTLGQRRG